MHPPEETLLAVATGQADRPHRVMVEGHLDTCPSCRAMVGEMSSLGGALLERLDIPEIPTGHLWEPLRLRIQELPPGPAPDPVLAGIPVPEGARRELPPLRPLRWRWPLARGARYAVLCRDRSTGSVLILARMAPRRVFPRHVHLGPEDVLVLAGGYEDEQGIWEAGGYAAYAPGTEHRPLTEPDEECWTLTRLERPNLFLGWRGWAQRLLGLG